MRQKSSFTLTGGTLAEGTQIISDKGDVEVSAVGYDEYTVDGTTKKVWTNKGVTQGVTIVGKNTVYGSIGAAIEAADNNATINVAAGTYELSKQLLIAKPITIVGTGEVIIKFAWNK